MISRQIFLHPDHLAELLKLDPAVIVIDPRGRHVLKAAPGTVFLELDRATTEAAHAMLGAVVTFGGDAEPPLDETEELIAGAAVRWWRLFKLRHPHEAGNLAYVAAECVAAEAKR